MRDIAGDAQAHNVILSRGGTAKDNREPPRGSGWVEPPSISGWQAQTGIDIVDHLVDQQDRLDRAQRIKELAEASRHLQALAAAEEELKAQEKGPEK
jgi:hypothetical protein